jgi:uncharacterized membrane protein HdeD (DUF308 family)
MLRLLSRNWWYFVLRGLIAVVFGVLALVYPLATITTLVILFGVFALADGTFDVIASIASAGSKEHWWAELLAGVAGIIFGALILLWPGMTALVLLYLIAGWAVARGILEIAAAIRLRKVIQGELILILSGLISVLLGLFLFARPGAGAIGMAWLIGIYAILFGFLAIILGFRLRGLKKAVEKVAA